MIYLKGEVVSFLGQHLWGYIDSPWSPVLRLEIYFLFILAPFLLICFKSSTNRFAYGMFQRSHGYAQSNYLDVSLCLA